MKYFFAKKTTKLLEKKPLTHYFCTPIQETRAVSRRK